MNVIIEEKYLDAVKGLDERILQDVNKWYDHINNLPIEQQITYTVSILDWQVKNGGFHQYFFNSYGIFVFLTLKNLEELKLFEIKNILSEALGLVNYDDLGEDEFKLKIFSREIKKISDFDEELLDCLDNLDDSYYSISGDKIIDSLVKYLRTE